MHCNCPGFLSNIIVQNMKINSYFLLFFLLACTLSGVIPTSQIMLYPNTENSPSLYLISFQTSANLRANQYILISMDWLSSSINPFSCILVNTTINIRCSNLNSPTFTLGFSTSILTSFNPQISLTKTVVIELLSPLPAGVQYFLQIGLVNLVQNLKKVSPSLEFYCIGTNGLIHEINLNFGPVTYKPPTTAILDVSVYTDINNLAMGSPGSLVTMKVQITISIPVTTPQSSIFVVLQSPFTFSTSSYITVADSEQYITNPSALNKRPTISFSKVLTPQLFYVAFNQSFAVNRQFILFITEIKNPFFIASSNISIYSANFNSLTPLEAFQRLLPLKSVTQTLNLNLGLPYDMPMGGPCIFYRNRYNYYQIKFYMPLDVPAGYAIKVLALQHTISEGTAYVDFQSLNYTVLYDYFGSANYFIMRSMGPILQGSLISIIFKGYKNSITNFYIDVFIDTEAVIAAGSASSYMFYGRVAAESQDADDFYQYLRTSPQMQYDRASSEMTGSEYLLFNFHAYPATSTGSYVEFYLSPKVQFASNFNSTADCRYGNVASSSICTVTKTANYVKIKVVPTASYSATNPNAFPQSTTIYLYIYNIRFPVPSSTKNPYMIYLQLYNSSAANPTSYIEAQYFSVAPKSNMLSASITLTQHGNMRTTTGLKYPSFVRFSCTNPSVMNYVLQQNQVRIISIMSTHGFRDMLTLKNEASYPCSSRNPIKCIYKRGIVANGDWWQMQRFTELERIDIFFLNGSTETTQNFQIIIPDSISYNYPTDYYYYFYAIGIYNKLTKDIKYMYRNSGTYRYYNWISPTTNLQSTMYVDFQGKAGSYRTNVSLNVETSGVTTNYQSYIMISSSWQLFEKDISSYTSDSLALTNPLFYTNQLQAQSIKLTSGMWMSVFPFKISSSLSTFNFTLDNLHLPYHYDLPNYYIFVISNSNNDVVSYNQFQMTNQGIFYATYLKSLTVQCVQNFLGVKNTQCTIIFGTQNPLKADGKITMVFSGINVATNTCSIALPNGTLASSTCSSTSDNKNVTISIIDTFSAYHYPANNFTAVVNGISIMADEISQSVTLYLKDSTGNYVIEQGNRILTTTVARPEDIQIFQINFQYLSPLSANKMQVRFYLPRSMISDERFGFIIGKDLSDVNLEVVRLKIVLTRSDGVPLQCIYQLITSEYKILFTFMDQTLFVPSNYTLEIYGIMTPVSLQNGAFSIIYQRGYDKAYTLINSLKTTFPTFSERIISNISLDAYFNTEGYEQKLMFTMLNTKKTVDSKMVWIVNFPSYYNAQLFNYNSYCMIDTTPIQCNSDPTTPYQLIIANSPKLIQHGTLYTISIHRITCPRGKYTNNYYRSYYLFIGVLQSIHSDAYVETALLYPEQAIQSTVNGILTISDFVVNSLTKPTFSTIYAVMYFKCNVAISTGSYLFLIFPLNFDNFNNKPINIIFKVAGVIKFSYIGPVIDRTLQILITTSLTANTDFTIQFPSLPTPKSAGNVPMSQMIGYITPSTKKSIIAASSIAGNSAPIVTFTADTRYLSFNNDNSLIITAGTFSELVDIKSSDGNPFLTNINVNLTSSGFTFQPSTVFLKLGDKKGQFRVGADDSLFPIAYFYETVKTQQMFTYYTITTNNNIMVVNTPVNVIIPSSINVPIGGCSVPFTVDIVNPPIIDVTIAFIYNNVVYNESIFNPNIHITKSQLSYTPDITKNMVSFCVANNFATLGLSSSFIMRLSFVGTNYKSYKFSPSQNVTINIVPSAASGVVSIMVQMINRQKTFVDFNITPNIPGIVYYYLKIGQNQTAMDLTQLKIYLKNNQFKIENNQDYLSHIYTRDRDTRVGISVRSASGVFTLRLSDMLPERFYTFCVYLQSFYNIVSSPMCITIQNQIWGQIMRAKVQFSSPVNDQNLNNVLCFFTKNINTQVQYVVDLEGNSCDNHKVKNLYYNYPGQSFKSENSVTNIYIITNPYLTSDPSPTSFLNMFSPSGQITGSSISAALSGFAINFLSSNYLGLSNAIGMTDISHADEISINFDEPVYSQTAKSITVSNIKMSNFGTTYFVLVLYKQVHIDGNNTYVKIRLNSDPNQEQILNCLNWQNLPAEGCARAVYSYDAQSVIFTNIKQNCMYKLYYMAASQYPLRPIVSSNIQSNSIVTFTSQIIIRLATLLVFIMIVMAL